MNIEKFKNILFEKASEYGFSDFEIYYRKSADFKINVFKGDVEKYQNNSMRGVSFRGLYNGYMGYSYSEKTDEEDITYILNEAKLNSEILENKNEEFIYDGNSVCEKLDLYSEKIAELSSEQQIEMCKRAEKAALCFGEEVVSCSSCFAGSGEGEVFIANSKGLLRFEKMNYFIAYISVSAERNGQRKSAGEFWSGSDIENFNPEILGKNAAKKAISYLGGISLSSEKRNSVLKNEAFAQLIGTFIGGFYAENVQKGFSLFKGKLNEKIASDCITIKDVPLLSNGFASCSFDSEGVASFNKTVIEKGILKTFLYNLKSAKADGVQSTANGFKSGYKSSVSTSATNFVIEPGKLSFNELLENMKDGILITDFSGLHSGANSVSGDFSLGADGFVVRDGKISDAFEQITVAGNFYELLLNVKEISDDLFYNMPSANGAVVSPSVFVGEIDTAG